MDLLTTPIAIIDAMAEGPAAPAAPHPALLHLAPNVGGGTGQPDQDDAELDLLLSFAEGGEVRLSLNVGPLAVAKVVQKVSGILDETYHMPGGCDPRGESEVVLMNDDLAGISVSRESSVR